MDHYSINTQHHSGTTYNKRIVMHRNSRNILSILFDEVNCSDEKFDKLKKELHAKHLFQHSAHKDPCHDVFSSFT